MDEFWKRLSLNFLDSLVNPLSVPARSARTQQERSACLATVRYMKTFWSQTVEESGIRPVQLRFRRVIASSDPDQEWSETTRSWTFTLDNGVVKLEAQTNLATMVGANQYGRLEALSTAEDEATQKRAQTWLQEACEALSKPDVYVELK